MRATAAAVTGALALTALAIPAAQAGAAPAGDAAAAARAAHGAAAEQASSAQPKTTPFASRSAVDDSYGDTKISNVVVNGGKEVVVGVTKAVKVSVTFTVTDDSGVEWADAILWHGGSTFDDLDTGVVPDLDGADCRATSSTAAKCTQKFTIDPQFHLFNDAAGTWDVWAIAQGKDADFVEDDSVKTFKTKRLSKLSVNASPEPIKKGKTLTISGSLTRANWDTYSYAGYSKQSVKLQSRSATGKTYSTLKTYTSGSGSSAGKVKTTRTATKDTCWRYSFAGSPTSPAVTSSGDCVDVR